MNILSRPSYVNSTYPPPLRKWKSSTKFCTVIDSNSLHSYHRSDIAFLKGFLARLVTRTTMTTTDPQQIHSWREACLSPSGEFTMVRTRFSCKYRRIFRKRPHVWSCYGTRETMSLSFEQLILEIWNSVIIHISQFLSRSDQDFKIFKIFIYVCISGWKQIFEI